MRKENLALKAAAERQAYRADQTLELTTICYGILRHDAPGFLVAKPSTSKFSDYESGLRKRVRLQAESARRDDTLVDASFDSVAGVESKSYLVSLIEVAGDDFARSLSEVTKVPMVSSNEEQSVLTKRPQSRYRKPVQQERG